MNFTAFKGLYFREWKMMRGFFIGQFIILIVMFLLPWGSTFPEKLVELLIFSGIIIPAAMIFSLNTEVNQMELFLHNPQSIHKLLFVKILNGFVFAIIYALVLIIPAIIVHLIWSTFSFTSVGTLIYLLNFTLQMIIISIPFTVLLLFLWALHQILRKYSGVFSLIIVVAVLVVGFQLMAHMEETGFYQILSSWGPIQTPFNKGYSSPFAEGSVDVRRTIYLGNYIFYGIISVILYFISAYLIDRKVEV